MANLRAIRTRIRSIENTRQITKSMKMVAAAKLRKTQSAFSGLKAYADKSGDLLSAASCGPAIASNPYLSVHAERKKVCYVLIVGNRGLCGTYNHALLRRCRDLIRNDPAGSYYLISCGRWGKDIIASEGLRLDETFEISDTPTHEEALRLAEHLKALYREEKADEIVLVYQQYKSVLSQTPTDEILLPLKQEEKEAAGDGMIYEPDRESLLNVLLDMYIGNTVHAVLLEARTGEHSARMTAMTAAADNTEELIEELTLELNHARQAAITTEISEIAGGAEALRNNTAGG